LRLWSLHPRYLDPKGLVALWREGLLAQKVLQGQTKGYTRHPQLDRFQCCADALLAIGCYLSAVADEAEQRGYRFDRSKIVKRGTCPRLTVQQGQLDYEWRHLSAKLQTRAPGLYARHIDVARPVPHPVFEIVPGGIEDWERF
jgi:hypothetical protein